MYIMCSGDGSSHVDEAHKEESPCLQRLRVIAEGNAEPARGEGEKLIYI